MSGNIESALVIELVEAIKWGAALEPTAADGSLTVVDPAKPIDITQYSRRDRELAYRDLINATAVVKVSLHTESVWNTASIRPKLQGITVDDLPPTTGDLGASDSTVLHVKNSSLPVDALATDKDLAGRDAMIYEVLAKACEVFEEPPITSPGSGRTGVTAWSLAEGVDYNVVPSPSLPLNKDAFYRSDVTLAQRDNFVAAYASRIAEILKNPFAFATRLYVRIDGTDSRDAEIYALVRRYYEAGTSYAAGEDVFYQTKWYRALNPTTSVPTNTSDWSEITSPRYREWTAEPALPYRNRIIYDTVAKTLQWFRETTDTTHVPQLYAMSIPGLFVGQTINTLAQVPQRFDAQYWRQKAARIDYNGTESQLLSVYQDTTRIGSGVHMSDAIGLTAPSSFYLPLGAPVYTGHKYRFSALVKPVNQFDMDGNRNLLGVTGDGVGAEFTGDYKPTSTTPGKELTYSLNVPSATWYISIEYTNLSGTTSGFGLRVLIDGEVIADDTVPLLFQDDAAEPLENGTAVRSQEWQFNADGAAHILGFIWSYGSGDFQINSIRVRTSDRFEAEYFVKAEIHDNDGNDVYFGDAPTIESTGRKNIREILNWDFTVIADAATPEANITWMSSSDLPIKFSKLSMGELVPTFATAGVAGFDSFKGECLKRAERSVQTAFASEIMGTDGTLSDFTSDGTIWNDTSSENWMALIEAREPRLRHIPAVTSIRGGFQYEVVDGGYVVYNEGTYSDGEVFNGTSTASTFISYGADTAVDQIGAFRKSTPSDLGHPALMPLGLRFDETNNLIRMDNEPSDQVPTVVACQPWMVEAGLYSADGDFRAGDTAASSPDTVTISVAVDPTSGGTVFGAGRYAIFDSVTLAATPAGSETTYFDYGVDIAIVCDESGSMAPAAPFIASMLNNLNTLLTNAGLGVGAYSNKYAFVGFGGTTTSHGHTHSNFTDFASFLASIPAAAHFSGGDEDGYIGIDYALTNLSWRASSNVIKFVILLTDEDRNFHYYTTGGGTQAAQFASLQAALAAANVKLIAVNQTYLKDATAALVLGYRYGGSGYKADGLGGFTTTTGCYGYVGNSYSISGFGGDTPFYPTGMYEEYELMADNSTIQGQVWDFGQIKYGGVATSSFQAAMVAAILEDITLSITTDWTFVGWFDENGNLLSTSTLYSFTAVESMTVTARFQQT